MFTFSPSTSHASLSVTFRNYRATFVSLASHSGDAESWELQTQSTLTPQQSQRPLLLNLTCVFLLMQPVGQQPRCKLFFISLTGFLVLQAGCWTCLWAPHYHTGSSWAEDSLWSFWPSAELLSTSSMWCTWRWWFTFKGLELWSSLIWNPVCRFYFIQLELLTLVPPQFIYILL